jgi:outer membrane lipoprotein-sorting protein
MMPKLDQQLRQYHERLESDAAGHRRRLMTALSEQVDSSSSQSRVRPAARVLLFKRRIVQVASAAAAAIVFAALITVFSTGSASTAFADIVQPILEAQTATFSITISGEGQPGQTADGMFMAPSRMRMTTAEGNVVISDTRQWKIVNLVPAQKQAMVIEVSNVPDDGDVGKFNMFVEIRRRLALAQQLDDESVEYLGERQIDNRSAIGYHVSKPDVAITVWADAATLVPVELTVRPAALSGATVAMTNIVFDVDLDESLFSTDVPDGYSAERISIDAAETARLAATPGEEELLAMFRLWADEVDGRFPSELKEEAQREFVWATERNFEAERGPGAKLSVLQRAALLRKFVTITRGFRFVESLPDDADWHYAGTDATRDGPRTAIFWYRPSGSDTYRVIYSDLTVGRLHREGAARLLEP